MEPGDVARIVNSVLSDMAAPYTLLKVNRNEAGWRADLKKRMGRVITVRLPDGPPPAIRTAMMQFIEAAMDADA